MVAALQRGARLEWRADTWALCTGAGKRLRGVRAKTVEGLVRGKHVVLTQYDAETGLPQRGVREGTGADTV